MNELNLINELTEFLQVKKTELTATDISNTDNDYEIIKTINVYMPLNRNRDFCANFKLVKSNGKFGLAYDEYSSERVLFIPCEYDEIETIGSNANFILKQGDKYKFCDFVAYDYNITINMLTGLHYKKIELNTDSDTEIILLYENYSWAQLYIPKISHLTKSCNFFNIKGRNIVMHTEENLLEILSLDTGEIICEFDENDFKKYFC